MKGSTIREAIHQTMRANAASVNDRVAGSVRVGLQAYFSRVEDPLGMSRIIHEQLTEKFWSGLARVGR